ncbi:short-chain dehydrogenase [Vibrio sinaloensis]|uniref:SDR family NAD(P)-dependent oxidoreductase n=1 Tax=Photobacterium sp. (strain ATCC 43367) TaxID=379097 RepID=UPI00057FF61C|nr:SDR family oxidoreductase [Vibrio sinaloensis]KIE22079.1 short-chain dehydrogenase [Vibrio sinaloensis]
MKTAFISGATSGIGLEFAKQLSQQGYALLLHGRNQEVLQRLQQELPNVQLTLQADLSDPAQLECMIDQLDRFSHHIDLAINNAGFGLHGEHLLLNQADIQAMLHLNITATTRLSHYFATRMVEQKSGHILNVASTAAYQPQPYLAAYAASKAYVASFTEALKMELKSSNVVVTCLSPGRTDTGFFKFDGSTDQASDEGVFSKKHRANPEAVAKIGLKALFAEKGREIPFWDNKLYVFLNRILSRNSVLNMYFKAMKSA